ncbi:DUF397 domain-containing protein [Kitasatospora sp. NPDC008050]|uniref:DUF397 domain-containing protein n=1 Tax=Kitasatospora sp. NPDC008050 TaxID=3364021 RepID=UPI0036E3F1E2
MTMELAWFKSSYSGTEGGACIEVAPSAMVIHVRDSKDKAGPQLAFTPAAWSGFIVFATAQQLR